MTNNDNSQAQGDAERLCNALCQRHEVTPAQALSSLKTLRIVLLTHETELTKASNTAGLAFDVLAKLQSDAACPPTLQLVLTQVIWQRKPNVEQTALRQLMATRPAQSPAQRFLLFPTPQATSIDMQCVATAQQQLQLVLSAQATVGNEPLFPAGKAHHVVNHHTLELVILDATWQRARKMYRQSPYLQQMPTLQFCHAPASQFVKRRNQVEGGWCTAEMIAMVWQLGGTMAAAATLRQRFSEFNR